MGYLTTINPDITERPLGPDHSGGENQHVAGAPPAPGSPAGSAAPVPATLTPQQERLITEHLSLATGLAAFRLRKVPDVWRGDIRSAAIEGLIQAARSYDPTQGIPFPGFAAWRIKGAMSDELRRLHLGRRTRKGNNWKDRSRDRSIEALAEAAGRGEAGSESLADRLSFLAVAEIDPARLVESDIELRLASDLVRQLQAEDRQILEMHLVSNLTLADIGRLVGVTESRISQRLKALKQHLRRLAYACELAPA